MTRGHRDNWTKINVHFFWRRVHSFFLFFFANNITFTTLHRTVYCASTVCKFKKFLPAHLFFVTTVEKFQILEYRKVAILPLGPVTIYVMIYDHAKFECGKWRAAFNATTYAEESYPFLCGVPLMVACHFWHCHFSRSYMWTQMPVTTLI